MLSSDGRVDTEFGASHQGSTSRGGKPTTTLNAGVKVKSNDDKVIAEIAASRQDTGGKAITKVGAAIDAQLSDGMSAKIGASHQIGGTPGGKPTTALNAGVKVKSSDGKYTTEVEVSQDNNRKRPHTGGSMTVKICWCWHYTMRHGKPHFHIRGGFRFFERNNNTIATS